MDCHDKERDKEGDSKRPSAKASSGFENCVVSCADTHIKLLPNITKKVQTELAKFS